MGFGVFVAVSLLLGVGVYTSCDTLIVAVVVSLIYLAAGVPLLFWLVKRLFLLLDAAIEARSWTAMRARLGTYLAWKTVPGVVLTTFMLGLCILVLSTFVASTLRVEDVISFFRLIGRLEIAMGLIVPLFFMIGKYTLVSPALRTEVCNIKQLLKAVEAGQQKTVELLLSKGVSADVVDTNNARTALHLASHAGHCSVVKLLLERGASIQARDKYGFTPLHRACSGSEHDVARLLLKHGADVNAVASDGETPLHCAVSSGAYRQPQLLATTLVKHGADVNARDNAGDMPLHRVVAWGGWGNPAKVVKKLLTLGAIVDARNNSGVSPLDSALRFKNKEGYIEVIGMLAGGEIVGFCAACGGPIIATEPFYEKREQGLDVVEFPVAGRVYYDVGVALFHKTCAEESGQV